MKKAKKLLQREEKSCFFSDFEGGRAGIRRQRLEVQVLLCVAGSGGSRWRTATEGERQGDARNERPQRRRRLQSAAAW